MDPAGVDPLDVVAWVIRGLLALAFVGMGVNHFRRGPRKVMAKMVPPSLTRGDRGVAMRLVLFTGVCEVAGGVGLLVPGVQHAAAALLIVFLVAVFPANAYASEHPDRFGRLAFPFWPRFAGQLVLVGLLGVTLAA